jgi:hypothetical protein
MEAVRGPGRLLNRRPVVTVLLVIFSFYFLRSIFRFKNKESLVPELKEINGKILEDQWK